MFVVLHRNPFEIRSQILSHLFDQLARQARQLYPIAEFYMCEQFDSIKLGVPIPKESGGGALNEFGASDSRQHAEGLKRWISEKKC